MLPRAFRPVLVLLLATPVLIGCNSSRDVVAHGPFQKRKYQPGWNMEWRSHRGDRAVRARVDLRRDPGPVSAPIPTEGSVGVEAMQVEEPVAMLIATPVKGSRTKADPRPVDARPMTIVPQVPVRTILSGQPVGGKDHYLSERPFSWFALIALLVAIIIPIAGVVMVDNQIAVGGAVIGFILGLIAARRCRDKGRSGEGLAIAAMILSTVLIVLSIIGLAF